MKPMSISTRTSLSSSAAHKNTSIPISPRRSLSLILSSLVVLFICGTAILVSDAMKPPATASLPKHVFCFGDSLTAGTSPPNRELFPYGKNLQDELRAYGPNRATVEWKGFPGWTSSSLRTDTDLKGALLQMASSRSGEDPNNNNDETVVDNIPPFDLVILLAGTNDLAYESDPETIFESVRGIHDIVRTLGCPTLALGIPTSGYQSQHEPARALAQSVNEKLESWAASTGNSNGAAAAAQPRTTYVPYPIREFDRSSGFWAPDGLHFSPEGYEVVGKALAPIVAEILWNEGGSGEQ